MSLPSIATQETTTPSRWHTSYNSMHSVCVTTAVSQNNAVWLPTRMWIGSTIVTCRIGQKWTITSLRPVVKAVGMDNLSPSVFNGAVNINACSHRGGIFAYHILKKLMESERLTWVHSSSRFHCCGWLQVMLSNDYHSW